MPHLDGNKHADHRTASAAASVSNAARVAYAPVAQFMTLRNGKEECWSEGDKYVTFIEKAKKVQLGSRQTDLPALNGAQWVSNGGQVSYQPRKRGHKRKKPAVSRDLWSLQWTDNHSDVKIPQDCITAAELISAWVLRQDPDLIGEVEIPPTIAEAAPNTPVNPGDILFHLHDNTPGNFHGAAVIAKDGEDVITMEGDQSPGAITEMNPLFDMYAGHPGFHDEQNQSLGVDKTYVISFGAGRKVHDKLWQGIQDEVNKGNYDLSGINAATKIKDHAK